MKPQNKPAKTPVWNYIFFFIAGFVLSIIITTFVSRSSANKSLEQNDKIAFLAKQADSLETSFMKLQRKNENYASILSDKDLDSSKIDMLDSLNISITHDELAFLEWLDNQQIKSKSYDKNSTLLLDRIIAGYRSAVEQSNALSTIRNSFNIGNTDYSFDQNALNKMQQELSKKEMQIVDLTNKLSVFKYSSNANPQGNFKNLLNQQDSVINSVLQAQKKRNQDLISYNDKLKRDNDRLTNQLSLLQNQSDNNKLIIEATVSKNQLNDQVNFDKVDCYLSRADARQIISNAKQRRDILQNALEILNTLSQSPNADTRQAAEQKLNELKTIAANNHD